MKDCVFREYDIRGTVEKDLLIDQVYDVGRAIAVYFRDKNPNIIKIALGMDGRVHSEVIKQELSRAFCDSGMNVVFVGVCTSPILYFATHTLDVDASAMITASHNPKEDNGIKLMIGNYSLWGDDIRKIRDLYHKGAKVDSDIVGTETSYDIIVDYIAYMQKEFAHLKGFDKPFVIDCGNGAAGTVIPQLVKTMQWKNVKLLYERVDGNFPNHEADPTKEKNMRDVINLVRTKKYEFGIGFDGDADRCGLVLGDGTLLSGDRLLAILSEPVVKQNPGAQVVCNVVCSDGLAELVSSWGGKTKVVQVGRSFIENYMQKSGALIGGETSGHLLFADRYFGFDDGVYAMMRLIEIVHDTQKTVDELASAFPKKITSPEFRIFCPENLKSTIIDAANIYFKNKQPKELLTIDGVRASFDDGWLLIRKSNTQEVLSMRCESDTRDGLLRLQQMVYDLLVEYLNESDLQVLKK